MKHHVLGYRCNQCGADAPDELKTYGNLHQLQRWLKAHKAAEHKGEGRVRHGKIKRRERYHGNITDILDW